MGGLLGFINSWWMFLAVYPSFAMIMAHQKITILQPLYTEWWFLKMSWDSNLSPPSGKGSKFFSKIGICWNAVDGSFWTGEKKPTVWVYKNLVNRILQPSSTMVSWTRISEPSSLPSCEWEDLRLYQAERLCHAGCTSKQLIGGVRNRYPTGNWWGNSLKGSQWLISPKKALFRGGGVARNNWYYAMLRPWQL